MLSNKDQELLAAAQDFNFQKVMGACNDPEDMPSQGAIGQALLTAYIHKEIVQFLCPLAKDKGPLLMKVAQFDTLTIAAYLCALDGKDALTQEDMDGAFTITVKSCSIKVFAYLCGLPLDGLSPSPNALLNPNLPWSKFLMKALDTAERLIIIKYVFDVAKIQIRSDLLENLVRRAIRLGLTDIVSYFYENGQRLDIEEKPLDEAKAFLNPIEKEQSTTYTTSLAATFFADNNPFLAFTPNTDFSIPAAQENNAALYLQNTRAFITTHRKEYGHSTLAKKFVDRMESHLTKNADDDFIKNTLTIEITQFIQDLLSEQKLVHNTSTISLLDRFYLLIDAHIKAFSYLPYSKNYITASTLTEIEKVQCLIFRHDQQLVHSNLARILIRKIRDNTDLTKINEAIATFVTDFHTELSTEPYPVKSLTLSVLCEYKLLSDEQMGMFNFLGGKFCSANVEYHHTSQPF